jgi:non-specific serine/threonine protein kinase
VGTLAVPFPPDLAAHHEQCERQTRHTLGEQAFQTAYQHGKGLALGDAIAYALHQKPQAEPPPASTETTTLTRRQQEVADLVAEGLSDQDIAARLVISPRTAEGHVQHILTKLGFTSRTQIAAWAIPQPNNAQERRP